LSYEAMLASGRTSWSVGERVRVYRTKTGEPAVVATDDDARDTNGSVDRRDYDLDHYVRVLRDTFAVRMARALAPEDFAALFADPDQPELFEPDLETIRPVLREVLAV
jgi:DNA polymerase I